MTFSGAASERPAAFAAVALLRGGRILVASTRLCDITGYTARELTSPEFRPAQLFVGTVPDIAGAGDVGPDGATFAATLDPLRGPRIACSVTIWPVGSEPVPTLVLFVDADEAEARLADRHVGRALVRAASSELAESITRLRRIQIGIEALEHATPEAIARGLAHAAPLFEAVEALRAHVDELARLAPSNARPSPLGPFR